jgi:hypothetical protein
MTTHAISHESRTWLGWPSIRYASSLLKVRQAKAAARKRGARRCT